MNKQLKYNFIANIISFAVNIALALFITPYLINKVGSEAYGFIPLANNFVNYIGIFTAALNSMAGRFISIYINSDQTEQAEIYFNSVLRANTVIACALTAPLVVVVLNISKILNVPADILADVQLTFGFVFIGMIITLVGNVFSVSTFCKNRLELSSLRSIEGNLIKLGATIFLFAAFSPKIHFIALVAVLPALYAVLTNVYYTKKLMPEIKVSFRRYSGKAIKTLISSGLWNTVNQLSVVLLTNIDLTIANITLGSAPSGQYALAKTIPLFIQLFAGSISNVFVPQFTILYAQDKKEELLENIEFSIKAVSFITIIPISFLIIFGDTFFSLWVPDEDAARLFLLSNLTIIPMIIACSINPIFYVFTVINKLKIPAVVLLITGITNTAAVLALINFTSLGILAIPLVALITGIFYNLIFTPVYAARCLEVKRRWFYIPILKGIICSAVIMAVCVSCKLLININSWVGFIAAAVGCAVVASVINVFIMFNRRDRKNILNLF